MPLAGLDICKRSDPIRAEFGNHAAVIMARSNGLFSIYLPLCCPAQHG